VLDTTLCIKFVSDLRQVGGFLQVLRFPSPMKLTATIIEILLKVALNHITLTVVNYEHNILYELCIFNTTFNNIFNYIPGVSFIGRKMGTWRNHQTTASQLQNLAHELYRVPHAALVVMDTDCISRCLFM